MNEDKETVDHSDWIIQGSNSTHGSFRSKEQAETYAEALRKRRGLFCKVIPNTKEE